MRQNLVFPSLAVLLMVAGGGAYWFSSLNHDASPGDITRYVFVPSLSSPEVTLIDSETDKVAATINLPKIPDQILVSEAADLLLTSNLESKTVSLINIHTRSVEKVVTLDVRPEKMVLSPDGWLMAAIDKSAGSVVIFSLHRRKQHGVVAGFETPYRLTFDGGSSLIYVADQGTGLISTIDAAQMSVISKISITEAAPSKSRSYGLSGLTRTPNGRYGFCAFKGAHELAVIDLGYDKKVKKLPLGKNPGRPWGTADGRLMMVANNGDRTVSVIDTAALDIAAVLPGAKGIISINTGWFESVAFAISAQENKAVILDLMKLKKTGEISLPNNPGPGIVTHDGKKLYVALSDSNNVAVIDTKERKISKLIENVGQRPRGATMARSNNYCH